MADEDTINLINMILSASILLLIVVGNAVLTGFLVARWWPQYKLAKIFYSIVVEMAPSTAFADYSGGTNTTYTAIVNDNGADENSGQIQDKRVPTLMVTIPTQRYLRDELGHAIAYGGPPSKKINYSDAPLRWTEMQKTVGRDQALVQDSGPEAQRIKNLALQAMESEKEF